MQTITKVALDAMGGDNAPAEIVKGAVDAILARDDIKVFLVGQEDAVREELNKYEYPKDQIEIVDAPEIIEMAEPPVNAIRKKKQQTLSFPQEVPEPCLSEDRRLSDELKESRDRLLHQ